MSISCSFPYELPITPMLMKTILLTRLLPTTMLINKRLSIHWVWFGFWQNFGNKQISRFHFSCYDDQTTNFLSYIAPSLNQNLTLYVFWVASYIDNSYLLTSTFNYFQSMLMVFILLMANYYNFHSNFISVVQFTYSAWNCQTSHLRVFFFGHDPFDLSTILYNTQTKL